MKASAMAVVLVSLYGSGLWGQGLAEPSLESAAPLMYPEIAFEARVQGDVKLEFGLGASGEPTSVVAVSGFPLLREAAEASVRTWKFNMPGGSFRTEWKYTTTIRFKISPDGDPHEVARARFVDGYRLAELTVDPRSAAASHCPSPEDSAPPTETGDRDSVDLSRSGCYGTCPVYDITVAANGDVTWNGKAFVEAVGERRSRIGSAAALSLLQQFRSHSFWALCGRYDAPATDNATVVIQVHLGERSKSVSNYANSAPAWLKTLEHSIDEVAGTHVWRHGAPLTEPLGNISSDAYLPKPGVTALMRASAKADTKAIAKELEGGADLDATDSSGWTALMYAATNDRSEAVELLLAAGADVNHRSPHGDTPLMASAAEGSFKEELVRVGAEVNAQNADGVTALMILAAEGRSDEVHDALKAGGNPSLKDRAGRVALDYLRLSNCGKSPIPERRLFELDRNGECGDLDRDEVGRVTAELRAAQWKQRRRAP